MCQKYRPMRVDIMGSPTPKYRPLGSISDARSNWNGDLVTFPEAFWAKFSPGASLMSHISFGERINSFSWMERKLDHIYWPHVMLAARANKSSSTKPSSLPFSSPKQVPSAIQNPRRYPSFTIIYTIPFCFIAYFLIFGFLLRLWYSSRRWSLSLGEEPSS